MSKLAGTPCSMIKIAAKCQCEEGIREVDWRWRCNFIRDWQNDVSINIYIPIQVMLLQKQILREELIHNKVAFSSQIGTNKDINKEKTLASSKGTFWILYLKKTGTRFPDNFFVIFLEDRLIRIWLYDLHILVPQQILSCAFSKCILGVSFRLIISIFHLWLDQKQLFCSLRYLA